MNLPKSDTFETALTHCAGAMRHSWNRARRWWNTEYDLARFHYIRTRAEHGDALNEYRLGLMYEVGQHGLRSDYEAYKWFLRAAFQGVIEAQSRVSEYYRTGKGIPVNTEEAFK